MSGVATRVTIALSIWMATAFVGAAIFVALESDYERQVAQEIADLQARAFGDPGKGDGESPGKGAGSEASATGNLTSCGNLTSPALGEGPSEHGPGDESGGTSGSGSGGKSSGSGPGGRRMSEEMVLNVSAPCSATQPAGPAEVVVVSEDVVSAFSDSSECTNITTCDALSYIEAAGLSGRRSKQPPPDIDDLNWTFAGALFFCFTLMTTIGYGTFAPATGGGKCALVLFGFVGMVISGLMLGVVTRSIDVFLERVHGCCCTADLEQLPASSRARFKACAASMLLLGYFPLLALFAASSMDWNFGDALYFVFETVSTIGLGDLALAHESVGFVVVQFLLFVPGLALMAEYIAIGVEYAKAAEEELSSRVTSSASVLTARPAEEAKESTGHYVSATAGKETQAVSEKTIELS